MTPKRMANVTLCLLFAGAFPTQRVCKYYYPAMVRQADYPIQFIVFVLYNLCKHPAYLQPLRNEVLNMTADEVYGFRDHNTPLMDSFLKETARLFADQAS